jgi:hypothetical protein
VVSFYSYRTKKVYTNFGEKFTQHYAAHETAHGAVSDEAWASYLALRGAIKSGDPGWLVAELYYLHKSITEWRTSSPPEACSKMLKDKWQGYFQGYVDLVLSDTEMREYFEVNKYILIAQAEEGDTGVD